MAPKVPVLLEKIDVGALGRNTGEVIGVFGDVVPVANPGITNGFKSSIKLHNLTALEDNLALLRPPKWPAATFGENPSPERQQQVERGAVLYKRMCADCHAIIDRANLTTIVNPEMSLFDGSGKNSVTGAKLPPPGTDPWMACNAFDYGASSGILRGFSNTYLTPGTVQPDDKLAELLRITVASTLMGQKWPLAKEAAAKLIGLPRNYQIETYALDPAQRSNLALAKLKQLQRCRTSSHPNLGYISRPLNGIWATAPFLHNGSVPSIYELLLPPAKRSSTFFVGTREYDPKNLGFITTENDKIGNKFKFRARDEAGDAIAGNSNEGHDYSNGSISDPERYDLIEYLKTL